MRRFPSLSRPTAPDTQPAGTFFTARRQDAALAALIIVMQVIAACIAEEWHAPNPARIALVVIGAVALLWRRRHALPVTVLTVAADSVVPAIPPHQSWVPMASLVALYTLATATERRTAWCAGVTVGLWLTLASIIARPGDLLGAVVYFDFTVVAVAVGDSVRNRRAYLAQAEERARQAERTRDEEARRRVHEERVRIARDLHDVVAHHIALVNAQAGVARHLIRKDPDKAYQALSHITETSAAALDELRSTVSLLRQDSDPAPSLQPAPSLDRLGQLLEPFRSGGFDVRLSRDATPRPLTAMADLAAYRIIQEALTNAQKHATQPTAEVKLTYTDNTLWISVINPAHPHHRGPGTGHGLVGMRERAEAADGTLTASLRPDNTFRVYATLPFAPVKDDRS
ncbi:sensor histidine kinase [Streptomyces sp. NPDC057199]|uniref:sensor histidine kinase n=1 Tax=Streptomyces sp. NPDC057199 TaxID=3346047 RepID=UPI003641287D